MSALADTAPCPDDAMIARLFADEPDDLEFRKLRKRVLRETREAMLDDWATRSTGRREGAFRSLTNVRPAHLADPGRFDFAALPPGARAADG